ncbi:MAG TPA: cation:proton antiporter [Polyangiaceae bacterium]|nr:cation:proton antiporter [Polyangiaceae bacterium]
MTHELDLILTLCGALTAALLFGLLSQKLRLSPIVGYLVAGVAVGPFTPGFVAHGVVARQFAELGVILLMFGVGLNLQLRELFAVRRLAVPGALVAMAVAAALGLVLTRSLGWSVSAGVVYGLALAVASTVVLLRVFADQNLLHTQAGHVAIGWLLVEDLLTVVVIVLLPLLAGDGSGGIAVSVALALGKIVVLVVFTVLAGRRLIPAALALVAHTRSRELFTLAILVIALGLAIGSAKLFGASMALGAFLAGLVVGQSTFSSRAASEALPMRDAFAVLFFVATGMLLDPWQVLPNLRLTLLTLGVIFLAKPLVALSIVLLFRYPLKTALALAFGLAQIGEFSFMIAALGSELGVLPKQATQSLVAASIVSITLNPILFRLVEPAARRVTASLGVRTSPDVRDSKAAHDAAYDAIVVGYGPVGRSVTMLLTENGLRPTVIELNHETVAQLGAQGLRAIYGDATQREILERAGVREAGSLIFAASGPAEGVIRLAKELNPKLQVVARTNYVSEVATMRSAGADDVVSAEGEVALGMTERLLLQLGASADQLDQARLRVRREIFNSDQHLTQISSGPKG